MPQSVGASARTSGFITLPAAFSGSASTMATRRGTVQLATSLAREAGVDRVGLCGGHAVGKT